MTGATEALMVFGRYRVVAALGETRLAAVYRVIDTADQSTALLHLARRELVNDAGLALRFSATYPPGPRHPSLLQIQTQAAIGGRPCAISDEPAGAMLAEQLPLSPVQALFCLRLLAETLAASGPLHPPITSRNVLITPDGTVRLIENWAVALRSVAADLADYRAPELEQGRAVTAAGDCYALGVLLVEMMTGVRPRVLNGALPPLHRLRPQLILPGLDQLVATATAPPGRRFPDPAALIPAIDALTAQAAAPTVRLRVSGLQSGVRRNRAAAPAAKWKRSRTQRPVTIRRDWQMMDRRQQLQGSLVLLGLFVFVTLCTLTVAGQLVLQWQDALVWPGQRSGSVQVIDRAVDVPQQPAATYIVNTAEGLNLRRLPGAQSAAGVIAVLPNGSVVERLDGPLTVGSTDWLRVRAEQRGVQLEGWLMLAYLTPRP